MTYAESNPNFDEDFKNFEVDASYIDKARKNAENLERLGIDADSEDDTVFGAKFVYCASHQKAHSVGWCTVGVDRKRPLNAMNFDEALEEVKAF